MITFKSNYFVKKYSLQNKEKTITQQDYTEINFKGIVTKPIKLTADEFSKLKDIANNYNDIMSHIKNLNSAYKYKMKKAYPNIANQSKTHGFVFNLLQFFEDKRVKVFVNKLNKKELISLDIIDNSNSASLVQYKINKSGQGEITGDDSQIKKFDVNPFDNHANFTNIIDYFTKEFTMLKFYFKNYQTVKKLMGPGISIEEMHKIIENLMDGASVKLKSEINDIKKKYDELIDLFQEVDVDSGILKREYLGNLYSFISRGTSFKIPNEQDKVLNYFPINSKKDSRIFRLEIFNKKENKNENIYVFTQEGNVMQPKVGAKADYYEIANILPMSDKAVDSANIKILLENLDKEIAYLKNFVNESRTKCNQYILAANNLKNNLSQNLELVKNDVDSVEKAYTALLEKIKNFPAAKQLKREYMKDISQKQKIKFYRFPYSKNGGYLDFHPGTCRYDDRLFRLCVKDGNGKIENIFIFGKDGNVFSQKILTDSIGYSYAWNLMPMSDDDIKDKNIEDLLCELKNEIVKFDDYVSAYREEHGKRGRKTRDINKNEHTAENEQLPVTSKKQQKSKKIYTPKNKVKVAKTKLPKEDVIQKTERKNKQYQPKSKKVCTYKRYFEKQGDIPELAVSSLKGKDISILNDKEKVDMNHINQYLNSIFALPVEERSKEFKHKTLADGRLFSALFETKTKTGIPVTISKVKSPKYVDFIYYSIKFSHKNKMIVVNIDPETGNFLKSENGIAKVNKANYVQYISLKDFLVENNIGLNLLEEVFESFINKK